MMMVMMLFFKFNFIRRKKRNLRNIYTTCKQQRTAKYTYKNSQRSRKRSPQKSKEKKNVYILCIQTKVQKKVLLKREDLFEPPKKHFNFG